jgi:hypothetical protein
MKRYVNQCMELRVVARTNTRVGRESEGFRKRKSGNG